MKKISEHLGEIIVALAAICLLVTAVVVFKAPLSGFFNDIIDRETGIAENILGEMDGIGSFAPGNAPGGAGGNGGSGGAGLNSIVWRTMEYAGLEAVYDEGFPAAFKISSLTPTVDELNGGTIVVIDNGSGEEVFSVPMSASTIVEASENVAIVADSFYFVGENNSSIDGFVFSEGVWAHSDMGANDFTVTISW